MYLYSAHYCSTRKALRHGPHSFTCNYANACLYLTSQCFIQAHFGGKFPPPNFEFPPPQELEARSVYYVNVIPVSLLSAQY